MEQIYTIPVNEAFDLASDKPECGCPICILYKKLQREEIDKILGASMMEPDIRQRTNEAGFCSSHYEIMLTKKRMLGMALMMESHLPDVKKRLLGAGAILGDKKRSAISSLGELEKSCYVCSRIETNLEAMISTVVYLFETNGEFKKKFSRAPYFCLPHYRRMLEYASKRMSKRSYSEIYDAAFAVNERYIDSLSSEVSWFCKKFDYRYDSEPWYNSKDSVQRSVKFLSGDTRDDG